MKKPSNIRKTPEPPPAPIRKMPEPPPAPIARQLAFSAGDVNVIYRALRAYPCSGDEAEAVVGLIAKLRGLPAQPAQPAMPAQHVQQHAPEEPEEPGDAPTAAPPSTA